MFLQPLELGDVTGHIFHGNQYTTVEAREMMESIPSKSMFNPGGSEALDKWESDNADKGAHDYRRLMESWSKEESYRISTFSAKPDIYEKAADQPNNDMLQNAAAMRRFMEEAPTSSTPIYRGASAQDLSPGFQFELPPSSFSNSEGVASNHALLGEDHPTVIEIQGSHRSLPVGGLSRYPEEDEQIAAGKYEVVSSSRESAATYGGTADVQHLIVKQVG
jgi:hypothetical protein